MGAKIYNSNLTKELIDVAKLQQSKGEIPSELAEKVIPVIDINPKHARVANVVKRTIATNATAQTIYTTPTDKDFYLTSASLAMIKDATATSLFSTIQLIPDGSTSTIPILLIPGFTLTAQTGQISLSFPAPIKVAKGTNITINNSTNVGNVSADGCITGYLIDN